MYVCVCMYNSFMQTPAHVYIQRERSLKIEASYDVGNIYFLLTDGTLNYLPKDNLVTENPTQMAWFNKVFTCSASVSFLPGLPFSETASPPCCVVFSGGLSVKGSCPALPKSK